MRHLHFRTGTSENSSSSSVKIPRVHGSRFSIILIIFDLVRRPGLPPLCLRRQKPHAWRWQFCEDFLESTGEDQPFAGNDRASLLARRLTTPSSPLLSSDDLSSPLLTMWTPRYYRSTCCFSQRSTTLRKNHEHAMDGVDASIVKLLDFLPRLAAFPCRLSDVRARSNG